MWIAEKFRTYQYWALEDVDIYSYVLLYLLINLVANNYIQDQLIKNNLKIKSNT